MHDYEDRPGIEKALDVLLGALHDFDLKEVEKPNRTGTRVTFADIMSVEINEEPEQAAVSDLIRAPIGSAYRQAIRTLGQGLFDLGGLDLMDAVADRLQDHPHGNYRGVVVDHAWEGLGSGDDRWWP